MKIRSDYVTNSSSSSFILAFEKEDEYYSWNNFVKECEFFNYDEFLKLICSYTKYKENCDKKNALQFLFNYYSVGTRQYLFNEYVKRGKIKIDSHDWESRNAFEKTQEFQDELNTLMKQNKEYVRKRKQIEDADSVILGTVWDLGGGIMEWAIRHGFIEDNFRNNCVAVWNEG